MRNTLKNLLFLFIAISVKPVYCVDNTLSYSYYYQIFDSPTYNPTQVSTTDPTQKNILNPNNNNNRVTEILNKGNSVGYNINFNMLYCFLFSTVVLGYYMH